MKDPSPVFAPVCVDPVLKRKNTKAINPFSTNGQSLAIILDITTHTLSLFLFFSSSQTHVAIFSLSHNQTHLKAEKIKNKRNTYLAPNQLENQIPRGD